MTNIVFLVRNYKPLNSAVGICIANITEVLQKDFNISVICEKSFIEQNDKEMIDGEQVIRFITKQSYFRKKCINKIESTSGIRKRVYLIWYKFIRLYYNIVFLISKQSVQKDLIKEFYKALEEFNERIDLIVPACMPIEGLIAAREYCKKHEESFFIPILFDKFAANGTLHRLKINKKFKWNNNVILEKNIFDDTKCKKILYIEAWKNHIINNYFSSKFELIEHPLLKKMEHFQKYDFDYKRVNLVYTGALTKLGRNPEETLKCIVEVFKIYPDIQFHLFAIGDAIDIIEKYGKRYQKCITYHGQVATEIAHCAMNSADILVSIGNEDITQIPSKLFEYMSCGKPIIHFAKYNDDPAISILKNYPLSLFVLEKNENLEEMKLYLSKFIRKNQGSIVKFNEVANLYKTALPEYTAQLITKY